MTLSVMVIKWCARHSVCTFQSFSRDSFTIRVAAVYRHHCAPPVCLFAGSMTERTQMPRP